MYVGNLSFDATRDDVREVFEAYGACDDVYLPLRDGVPRGFGFVTMAEEDADNAMAALDGTEFFARKLIVNEPLKEGETPVRRPRVDRSKQCTCRDIMRVDPDCFFFFFSVLFSFMTDILTALFCTFL